MTAEAVYEIVPCPPENRSQNQGKRLLTEVTDGRAGQTWRTKHKFQSTPGRWSSRSAGWPSGEFW